MIVLRLFNSIPASDPLIFDMRKFADALLSETLAKLHPKL